ncbi:MAG: prolyl oligopeptidase family serine peptidase [Candidatus Nanopelagicales bacterium]
MTDSFPRRKAATRGFRLGAPRDVVVSPDGSEILYLRSDGPTDPVNHLWRARMADTPVHEERVVDVGALLTGADDDLPDEERARRERLREVSGGITGYSVAHDWGTVAFTLSGRLWVWLMTDGTVNEIGADSGYTTPAVSPDGRWVAAVRAGAVELLAVDGTDRRTLRTPDADGVTWGSAEFIAAEEMGRYSGMWWSPASDRLLIARVDDSEVDTWWISDPSRPATAATPVRYPAAGTPNARVTLHLTDLDGEGLEVAGVAGWEYLARVRWDEQGPLVALQNRRQTELATFAVDPDSGTLRELRHETRADWVELVPGAPRWTDRGLAVVEVDDTTDTRRLLVVDDSGVVVAATPPGLQVNAVCAVDEGVTFVGSQDDPSTCDLFRLGADGGVTRLSDPGGWSAGTTRAGTTILSRASLDSPRSVITVSTPTTRWTIPSHAEAAPVTVAPTFLPDDSGWHRIAVLFPTSPTTEPLPMLMSPYGGPHSQRAIRAAGAFATEQWLADQGFCVVVADGPGSPSTPGNEYAIHHDFADPPLAGQIFALERVTAVFGDRVDPGRVGIRGWSFGGYLAALAVMQRPDLFHAAVAGAPVTDWELYDTHYTERYLGMPSADSDAYRRSSLLPRAAGSAGRPLLLIHGLADDNVVAAHTLRLSSALLGAGVDHEVLPLSGVTHITPQEAVAENLLRRELEFFRRHLG